MRAKEKDLVRKAQMDIYKIDSEYVLDEMTLAGNEVLAVLREKYQTGDMLSTEENEALAIGVIEFIISTQKVKKKGLKYNPIGLNNAILGSFKMALYEAESITEPPITKLLGARITETIRHGVNYSQVLFAYKESTIYAFCAGAGWQVVAPYANPKFGLEIMTRLIEPSEQVISMARHRGFGSDVAAQETQYKNRVRANEIVDFGQLFKDLSGLVSRDTLLDELGIELPEKRQNAGANFKTSFRIRKQMSLQDFGDLLVRLTSLMESEPKFKLEEWLGLSQIDRTHKGKKLRSTLTKHALKSICSAYLDGAPLEAMFISDPQISTYMSASYFGIQLGDKEPFKYEQFSDEKDFKQFMDELREANPKVFAMGSDALVDVLLSAVVYSFEDGAEQWKTKSKFINCLQICAEHDGKSYALIEGIWYQIHEHLNDRINRELPDLLAQHKSMLRLPKWNHGVEEDEYLDSVCEECGHVKLHRKRPLDNIELCDSMILEGKRVFLCHFKAGFNTDMRALTGQVKSSAALMMSIRVAGRIYEFQSAWEKLKGIPDILEWEIVKKAILREDGYSLIECVVFNPRRDVETTRSTIAKYELSTLIKQWHFDLPLEIALPNRSNDE